MPLREALRAFRHGMRRSRRFLHETVPMEGLPEPAAQIAGNVLQGLDRFAKGLDHATTEVARRFLSDSPHTVPALSDFGKGPESTEIFAEALYSALRSILQRMGDNDAFISEASLRRVYAESAAVDPDRWREHPADAAADMTLRLLDAPVLRDVAPELEAYRGERVAPVAVFAALLWLMADRSEEDADEALASAADLAVVLADEITLAAEISDRQSLSALFAQFAPHV